MATARSAPGGRKAPKRQTVRIPNSWINQIGTRRPLGIHFQRTTCRAVAVPTDETAYASPLRGPQAELADAVWDPLERTTWRQGGTR
eukprot:5201799-Alexandrium_andersonii.AAC.1